MTTKNIFVVVVIYNKNICDSISLNSLEKIKNYNYRIIVVDNSTIKNNNNQIANEKEYDYLYMDGNRGLSKPYNIAVNYVKEKYKDGYIIWMDDDTEITEDYFAKLNETIEENKKYDIIAPIIYGQDGKIYSPNDNRYLKNKLVKSIDEIDKIVKYNAINSCLCVNLNIYKDYKYDEILFLDQVDTNFFDDMRKRNAKFKTILTPIHQNFSQREEKLDKSKMIPRYKIRIKDIMRYGRRRLSTSFLSLIKSIFLSFQIGFKCKSIKFIMICTGIAISMFFKNIYYLLTKCEYSF